MCSRVVRSAVSPLGTISMMHTTLVLVQTSIADPGLLGTELIPTDLNACL